MFLSDKKKKYICLSELKPPKLQREASPYMFLMLVLSADDGSNSLSAEDEDAEGHSAKSKRNKYVVLLSVRVFVPCESLPAEKVPFSRQRCPAEGHRGIFSP